MSVIPAKLIEDAARELMARAPIDIPPDYREGVRLARDREQSRLPRFVLTEMLRNWDLAAAEGGLVALERALRNAMADATVSIPLRPNRVHPLTREDPNTNVGIHAPEV